jgi:hypothetical protein
MSPSMVLRESLFYGWDDRLYDTREYWFIHDGLLYEVTTFKSPDGWLSPIMQSRQLISTGAIAWGDSAHGGRIFLNAENEARRRIKCPFIYSPYLSLTRGRDS